MPSSNSPVTSDSPRCTARKVPYHESLRLSRLTSTLTKNASATPLTSTLTKTKDLKSFNINTYKKGVGAPLRKVAVPSEPAPLVGDERSLRTASRGHRIRGHGPRNHGSPSFSNGCIIEKRADRCRN